MRGYGYAYRLVPTQPAYGYRSNGRRLPYIYTTFVVIYNGQLPHGYCYSWRYTGVTDGQPADVVLR